MIRSRSSSSLITPPRGNMRSTTVEACRAAVRAPEIASP
jgi:hypothetical protein